MKNLVAVTSLIIALSSCKSYQYVNLESNLNQTTKTKHYYHQDENVYIDFDFSGADFPMSIYVENIGSDTLYFDLSKTLYLVNDVIVRDAVPSNEGRIVVYQDKFGSDVGVSEMDTNQNVLIIPSGEKLKMYFNGFLFPYDKKLKKSMQAERVESGGKIYYVNSTEISDNQSPDYQIDFYFSTDSNFENGYDVVCVFSPESVYSDSRKPQNFPIKDPTIFYTSYESQAGGAIATIAVLGIGLVGILAPYQGED